MVVGMMMGVYRRWRARRRARIEAILRAREAARGLGPRPGTDEVDRARVARDGDVERPPT